MWLVDCNFVANADKEPLTQVYLFSVSYRNYICSLLYGYSMSYKHLCNASFEWDNLTVML